DQNAAARPEAEREAGRAALRGALLLVGRVAGLAGVGAAVLRLVGFGAALVARALVDLGAVGVAGIGRLGRGGLAAVRVIGGGGFGAVAFRLGAGRVVPLGGAGGRAGAASAAAASAAGNRDRKRRGGRRRVDRGGGARGHRDVAVCGQPAAGGGGRYV